MVLENGTHMDIGESGSTFNISFSEGENFKLR